MKSLCLFLLITLSTFLLQGQELYFPPNFSSDWETIAPSELNWCEDKIDSLNIFLEETNTNSFIILKDGRIALESYFGDFDLNSSWYWASAGKSLTAAMVGILQDEGALNIEDATSDYLGEGWTNCESVDEEKITIKHQLTMTTGFDYTMDDCIEPDCLTCLNEPGEEWFYHNAPYTLLADVIESASGVGYTASTNSKLANKIGFLGLWTEVQSGRLFFSSARGMARYGLLMLNDGDWKDEEIIKDKLYLQDMISTSQEINKAYGYLWWLNGKESYRLPATTFTFSGKIIPGAPDDLYAAIGKNGQILLVVPSQNLVIVRMGDNPDDSLVPTVYVNEIWEEYSKLTCTVGIQTKENLAFNISPSLVNNYLHINTSDAIDQIIIYNLAGIQIKTSYVQTLDLSDLRAGIYFIEVSTSNKVGVQKFVKL